MQHNEGKEMNHVKLFLFDDGKYDKRYPGPTGPDPTHVGAAYFGLVPKYENPLFTRLI